MQNRILIFFLLLLAVACSRCGRVGPQVKLKQGIDPDIVLVNIGHDDRGSIARIIRAVDSCQPAVIVVNAVFKGRKSAGEDSLLAQALRAVPNDILIYDIEEDGDTLMPYSVFSREASVTALTDFEFDGRLVSRFTPLRKKNGIETELLPLAVVKKWKPGIRLSLRPNQKIDVVYQYTAGQFNTLTGELFTEPGVEKNLLKGKVVILGFLGPGKEDMKRTPLRLVMNPEPPDDVPDTYGTIILANQVRTLLDYEKK